jgi:hypothetical protein
MTFVTTAMIKVVGPENAKIEKSTNKKVETTNIIENDPSNT